MEKDSNREKLVNQYYKMYILHRQIGAIENLKETPIFAISAFIFKAQLIEFELRRLILSLDIKVMTSLHKSNSLIGRIPRDPDYFEEKTLGQLIGIIKEFDGVIKDNFKNDLSELKELRNDFIHHLFSNEKTLTALVGDSYKGIEL